MIKDMFYQRHSTRHFLSDEISKETIEEILMDGCYAPSSKNRQPWRFVALFGETKNECAMLLKENIRKRLDFGEMIPYGSESPMESARVMNQAPVVIMVFNTCCKNESFCLSSDIFSIGAAVENIMLKAELVGLSSLCIGDVRFAENEIKQLLDEQSMLVCAVAIGIEDINYYTNNKQNRKKNYVLVNEVVS